MKKKTTNLSILPLALCILSGPLQADPVEEVIEGTAEIAETIGETVVNTGKRTLNEFKNIYNDATGERTLEEKKHSIDLTTTKTLNKLFELRSEARRLFNKSYGYAVFDTSTKSFLLTSTSGLGLAKERESGQKTYMNMLSLGANLGAGLSYSQTIFFFEDKGSFSNFVNNGWEAKGRAEALLGEDSVQAEVRFVEGIAIYHLNETGILLDAHIAGTKYWKDSTLNEKKNS